MERRIQREYLFVCEQYILSPEGGTHLAGFRNALTRVINDYGRRVGAIKATDQNLTGDDVREGTGGDRWSVKLIEPQVEGQTEDEAAAIPRFARWWIRW